MIVSLIESGVIALIGYFILMWFSVNLLGFFVRGLFTDPELNTLEKEGPDFIKKEVAKSRRADIWINIVALVLLAGYFYLLFHFINIMAVLAALVIMASRTPDLIWEIKHGKKVNPNEISKDWLFFTTSFLTWAALPVFWYALYTAYF